MSIQQSVNNMLATAAVIGGVAKHGIEQEKQTKLAQEQADLTAVSTLPDQIKELREDIEALEGEKEQSQYGLGEAEEKRDKVLAGKEPGKSEEDYIDFDRNGRTVNKLDEDVDMHKRAIKLAEAKIEAKKMVREAYQARFKEAKERIEGGK